MVLERESREREIFEFLFRDVLVFEKNMVRSEQREKSNESFGSGFGGRSWPEKAKNRRNSVMVCVCSRFFLEFQSPEGGFSGGGLRHR